MKSPESLPIVEMASGAKGKGKPESSEKSRAPKTQEHLREALKKRFDLFASNVEKELNEYDKMLEDGAFDDKDGEGAGAGEKRRERAQAKLESMMGGAENLKKTLDSKKELPQSAPSIEATYTHSKTATSPERREIITLDIEQKTKEFLDLYQKIGLDIPPDFEGTIADIWERNSDEIGEAIEQNGFDEVLLVPAGLVIGDLSRKMKMENGYYEWIKSSGTTVDSLDGVPFTDSGADKPRIILVHKNNAQNMKDRPELEKTLNVKGQDVDLRRTLSLKDYIIFQRKYFEETAKHLDEDGWTWLSTKSGARLVYAHWDPDGGKLSVRADDLGSQNGPLGARPSRSFF